MRTLIFSIVFPAIFIILGIILILLKADYGIFVTALGVIWLVLSFLIEYKEEEDQPLGIGRGRKR